MTPISARLRRRLPRFAWRDLVLTLPLLLILVLSLVEFVRVVIVWGTLQYAADVTLRFGSGGQIEWDLFAVDGDVTNFIGIEEDTRRILDEIVPCVDGEDARGTLETLNGVQIFRGGQESLFATWYDGIDCDPENQNHTRLRRDLLRLITMLYAAHEAAGGLFTAPNPYTNLDAARVESALYQVWQSRSGAERQRGAFEVEICSSRSFLNASATPLTTAFGENQRFVLLQNVTDTGLVRIQSTLDDRIRDDYRPPYCMLNEIPRPAPSNASAAVNTSLPLNAGVRWWDAGGSGDEVTLILSYNHTFLTPLLNSNLIRLEVRSSRQNSEFRLPRVSLPFTATPTPSPTATPSQITLPVLTQTPRPIFPRIESTTPNPTMTVIFERLDRTPTSRPTETPLPYITPRVSSGE